MQALKGFFCNVFLFTVSTKIKENIFTLAVKAKVCHIAELK